MKNGLDLSDQIGSSKPGKRGLKVKEEMKQEVKEEVESDRSELQTRKTRHKVHSKLPAENSDYNSSEEELWEEPPTPAAGGTVSSYSYCTGLTGMIFIY